MQTTTTATLTLDNAAQVGQQVQAAAFHAADTFFHTRMNGQDLGACGFAWVTVYPQHKGNTRDGRAERKILERLGMSKDWTGKAWQIWNPSKYAVQNIDTLEAGADAAAQVLKSWGLTAYSGSRMD